MILRRLCFVTLFALSACRGGGQTENRPDYITNPTALSFNACPIRDENGMAVQGVLPDTRTLTIENRGKSPGGLKLSITGSGAINFKLPPTAPDAVDSLSSIEIPVSFSPLAKGDVNADLLIDDENDETMNPLVSLVGSGSSAPSQATLETAPQKKDKSGFKLCTADAILSDCELEFPDTLMGQQSTLEVKIRNKGCPPLTITGLDIANPSLGFSIQSPSVLPTPTSPLTLSTLDGTDELTVVLAFDAVDDNSADTIQARFTALTITSNDQSNGSGFAPSVMGLSANAIKPAIYVAPGSCNFTVTGDRCGNPTRVDHKAKFTINNEGGTPVTISAVRFKSSGTTTGVDGRFTVSQNINGQTIAQGMSAAIEVTEVDQPVLVSDQLEVVADIPGMGAGSAGTVVAAVISGIKPCMTTEPSDLLNFGDPADELTVKQIVIRNGTGCGNLKISGLQISTQPLFSLVAPLVPQNHVLTAGQSVEASVQYKRPPSGGQQLADVRIITNDTDYAAPQHKLVVLQSQAALDQIPLALASACTPAEILIDPDCLNGKTGSGTFYTSMLTPAEITLSGAKSTDDKMIKEYRFTMRNPPTGITTAALANNGMKITAKSTKLTIPGGFSGTVLFGLEVFDDRGQKSAENTIRLNIYP